MPVAQTQCTGTVKRYSKEESNQSENGTPLSLFNWWWKWSDYISCGLPRSTRGSILSAPVLLPIQSAAACPARCCLTGESTAAFKVLRPDWVSATVTHQDLVAQHAPRPVHSLTNCSRTVTKVNQVSEFVQALKPSVAPKPRLA